ncbi:pyridoxamine 5'-phosphate oxidase family protein, partial [Mycobacterium tuberculosis]|nr:pyridoxamine 5'-phosphate oxidase family protein [Mycobacterium tuberculosis]
VEFLSTGTRTGKIAWVAKDGRALVTPIWFIVEDGTLVFNTGEDTSKGRALQRDPRATIVVDDERPPFSFVQVQGTVT